MKNRTFIKMAETHFVVRLYEDWEQSMWFWLLAWVTEGELPP